MSAKQLQDCILQIVEQEEGLTLDDITARCKESFAEYSPDCNGVLTKEIVRDEVIELTVHCVVQMRQEFMGHDWTYWKGTSDG